MNAKAVTISVAVGTEEAALGAQFRAVRRRQRCYLQPLAAHLGCSINTVRWHEAGARMMRTDMLARAAAFMGVETSELVNTQEHEAKES